MPEYLAPGVYVEETSFRSKSIEGVSTTTTGFIGPTRFGPVTLEPDIVTSLAEFERTYGSRRQLRLGTDTYHNYVWHAARAFFEEGGKRLYISRVYLPPGGQAYRPPSDDETAPTLNAQNVYDDGHARTSLGSGDLALRLRARYPGSAGNVRVRFTVRLGQNILGGTAEKKTLGALLPDDVVWISDATSPVSSPPGSGSFYLASQNPSSQAWEFRDNGSAPSVLTLDQLTPTADPTAGDQIRVASLTLTVIYDDGQTAVWSGIALDPAHSQNGLQDSLDAQFGDSPPSAEQARTLPLVVTRGTNVLNGLNVLEALFAENPSLQEALSRSKSSDDERTVEVLLTGGSDGLRPSAAEYEGTDKPEENFKTGLKQFEDLEEISIVAAPGSTFGFDIATSEGPAIVNALISHAQRMRYRIAVLDSGNNQTLVQVRAMRARVDSSHAALYYPWVKILDPVTRKEIFLPPSGFVAGIYARNDVNRAVYKAPANEVVTVALGFEKLLNKAQQDILNPEGINCFRYFEGRGFRVWGARTTSSDPEWKYVNLRRYFAYLERSIDKGTQWAVFEPNGELLWANVRRTIEDFLLNEWQSGALLGDKPEKAFFVRCDRSTMTQNDLDNGRLICHIGVAALRPAEFVIFRIGQWTADRKS